MHFDTSNIQELEKGTLQIPFNNITHAKKKADELKKKYIGVKVVKVKEEILYIP